MNVRYVIAIAALLCGAASAMKVGEPVPDFSRADLAGKQIVLADYRGKVVVLNFWATWCPPCREEMPVFSQWQRDFQGKGLQVIGISMDDDVTDVKKFLSQFPVSYPIVMGDAKFAERFGGVLGLPLTYVIGRQGQVVARYQGETDLAKLQVKVNELLF